MERGQQRIVQHPVGWSRITHVYLCPSLSPAIPQCYCCCFLVMLLLPLLLFVTSTTQHEGLIVTSNDGGKRVELQ